MALAYGQVNASFYEVGVSGDQSSSSVPVKNGRQVSSPSNAPGKRGMANYG